MNEVLCSISRLICYLTPPVFLVAAMAVLAVFLITYRILTGNIRRAKWTFVALLLMTGFLAPVPNGEGKETGAFYPLILQLTGGYGACVYIGPPPPPTQQQEREGRPIKGLTCGSRNN